MSKKQNTKGKMHVNVIQSNANKQHHWFQSYQLGKGLIAFAVLPFKAASVTWQLIVAILVTSYNLLGFVTFLVSFQLSSWTVLISQVPV